MVDLELFELLYKAKIGVEVRKASDDDKFHKLVFSPSLDLAMIESMKMIVTLSGRDQVEVLIDEAGKAKELSFVGCFELRSLILELKKNHGKDPMQWPMPEGSSHSELLLRELLLKLKGQWEFPYKEEELCHCRSVSTQRVDEAIVSGAHSPESVSRRTQASTSCGTCRADVEKILNYRLLRRTS